jgi:hypothetical protein
VSLAGLRMHESVIYDDFATARSHRRTPALGRSLTDFLQPRQVRWKTRKGDRRSAPLVVPMETRARSETSNPGRERILILGPGPMTSRQPAARRKKAKKSGRPNAEKADKQKIQEAFSRAPFPHRRNPGQERPAAPKRARNQPGRPRRGHRHRPGGDRAARAREGQPNPPYTGVPCHGVEDKSSTSHSHAPITITSQRSSVLGAPHAIGEALAGG